MPAIPFPDLASSPALWKAPWTHWGSSNRPVTIVSRAVSRAPISLDYMVGQYSRLECTSLEPMALRVEGGTVRGLQRFIRDVHWDEAQMLWNYHQLGAEAMGDSAPS